jgi:hypothetical protein
VVILRVRIHIGRLGLVEENRRGKARLMVASAARNGYEIR